MHMQAAQMHIRHRQNATAGFFRLFQVETRLRMESGNQFRMRRRGNIRLYADANIGDFLQLARDGINMFQLIQAININKIQIVGDGIFQIGRLFHHAVEDDLIAAKAYLQTLANLIL